MDKYMKICIKCHTNKELIDFDLQKRSKDGTRNTCKKCRKISSAPAHRKNHLKRTYGITVEEWEQRFEAQNGCCAICGIHQSELPKRLHTDHDHITNQFRGLLCFSCNEGLGGFKDSSVKLQKAIVYLGGDTNRG